MKPRAAMFRTHARGSGFGVERMQNPHKAKEETYGYMRAGSMSVRVHKHKEKIKAPRRDTYHKAGFTCRDYRRAATNRGLLPPL